MHHNSQSNKLLNTHRDVYTYCTKERGKNGGQFHRIETLELIGKRDIIR